MLGICDTCEKFGELCRERGRTDKNCHRCSADIATITSLYNRMTSAGCDCPLELESEIAFILRSLLGRCKAVYGYPAITVSKLAA